jgi:hypothetical protein
MVKEAPPSFALRLTDEYPVAEEKAELKAKLEADRALVMKMLPVVIKDVASFKIDREDDVKFLARAQLLSAYAHLQLLFQREEKGEPVCSEIDPIREHAGRPQSIIFSAFEDIRERTVALQGLLNDEERKQLEGEKSYVSSFAPCLRAFINTLDGLVEFNQEHAAARARSSHMRYRS